MGIKKVKPVIEVYLAELKKRITPEKVILFGSYAKGEAGEESDIDLVVISSDFAKYAFPDRLDILYHARRHPLTRKVPMDIFGFTPEEYETASPLTTLGEVKETGVVIS